VNVATALHRIAKHPDRAGVRGDPRLQGLLGMAGDAVTTRESVAQPQELSRMAWSMSKLIVRDLPLLESLAAAAIRRCNAFGHQHLSNTAWSWSTLAVADAGPLLHAIASSALPKLTDFGAQALANTSWACARLRLEASPLMAALAAAAIPIITAGGDFRPQGIANTAWAFAKRL